MKKVTTFDGQKVPEKSKYYSKAPNQVVYFYDRNCTPIGDKSAFVIYHSDLIELPNQPAKPNWYEAPSKDAVWIEDNEPKSGSDFSGWHDEINDEGKYYECGGTSYLHDKNSDMFTVHTRPIEPIAEWDGKGFPPIGCECEYDTKFFALDRFAKGLCTVIALYKDKIWIDIHGSTEFVINTNSINFQPIQTKEDKEREAFIDKCIDFTDGYEVDGNKQLFEKLFDAGFLAPKGYE